MCVHTCLRCTHRQCPDVRDPRTLKIRAPRCPRYPAGGIREGVANVVYHQHSSWGQPPQPARKDAAVPRPSAHAPSPRPASSTSPSFTALPFSAHTLSPAHAWQGSAGLHTAHAHCQGRGHCLWRLRHSAAGIFALPIALPMRRPTRTRIRAHASARACVSCVRTRALSLTHARTHARTHSRTHARTHASTHARTHEHHALGHSQAECCACCGALAAGRLL